MPTGENEADMTRLSPDNAFATLGNETRMEILQALGNADAPLAFSELRDRVGTRDSGQFNYHLDKLGGHFVRKTDEGYTLSQAGRRVIEAVLSGAVTDVPAPEPAQIDWPCPYCGAPIEVVYDDTTRRPVKPYCTECAGPAGFVDRYAHGQLADLRFSPAGVHGRTPQEILHAAITWGHLEDFATYSGVCPRCLGRIEHSISVCEQHDPTEGICERCERRYAARLSSHCSNCIFDTTMPAADIVVAHPSMLDFLITHEINPLTDPWGPVITDADEEILSVDPFEARFTFTIGGDTLSLTVDDELSVIDIETGTTPDPE